MNEVRKKEKNFRGYEYKEVTVTEETASFYLDCYECFGWAQDGNLPQKSGLHQMTLRLKRDRKIINKTELTRLQRNFEACAEEISALKKAKTSAAAGWSLTAGLAGTAFLAGSTFAVTAQPPVICLCILLAVPGFIGWVLPWFLYKKIEACRGKKLAPLIEAKYDEIYEICEKGSSLLL